MLGGHRIAVHYGEEQMEINIDNLKIIGRGATSDVFLLGDYEVLKLFKPEYTKEAVDYEANIAYEINRLEITAPKMFNVIKVNNRFGIIYEYIKGSLLFDELLRKRNTKEIVKELVKKQIEINSKISERLPKQSARFEDQINKTDLDKDTKERIIDFVNKVPKENCVCHGDYHVGNIMRVNNELVILDWMNSYSGNKETDLIRSILMFESPYISIKLNMIQKVIFKILKRKIARIYKKEISKSVKIRNYKSWLVVVAAVRLSDNVPNEKKWLKRIIRNNIRHLTKFSTPTTRSSRVAG
jgi:thiamine kinase-like enzyme